MTKSEIWALLDQVKDPEIPVISIVELGIARAVNVDGNAVEVVITPTYSGCPAMREIEADIGATLAANGVTKTKVTFTLTPAWTTDWISESGRQKLNSYGIAPPQAVAAHGAANNAVFPLRLQIKCPRCGSLDTEQLSEFGSTACKALHRCRACLEPFDYFKPL